ncbi:MAG TPA: T9SS type B sorting domain-containing protein [Flavobacteriaceae bacterium]|nr:T9SS type B sorting domain-containing protein [Flavobacteriaceae bacterium]
MLGYPDFFMPNEDGINDTWNIIGLENQSDAIIYIFDRYGKLLTQIRPDREGWDGAFHGKNMPSNEY